MPIATADLSRRLMRYGFALIGPIGSAGAQFILTILLLRTSSPAEFGGFSFLLIASQLGWGVWTALFCAPLPVLLGTADEGSRELTLRSIFAANLAGGAIALLFFWALALTTGEATGAAALFGGYATVALMRWFARAHAYATGRPLRTTASDMLYSGALLLGIGLMWRSGAASVGLAWATLLASTLLGLAPFRVAYLPRSLASLTPAAMGAYRPVWRAHGRWSLLGTVTTEATANAQAYLVTLLYGPAAFAPVAASALAIRPITIAANALTEFERAQFARFVGERRSDALRSGLRFFRLVLLAVWLATAALIAGVLAWAPHILFPAHYSLPFLVTGTAFWMGTALVRLLRTPEATLLQAGGSFRPLALASLASSVVSISAVLALLAWGGPLWSIVGVVAGEMAFAVLTFSRARAWLGQFGRETAAERHAERRGEIIATSSRPQPLEGA